MLKDVQHYFFDPLEDVQCEDSHGQMNLLLNNATVIAVPQTI